MVSEPDRIQTPQGAAPATLPGAEGAAPGGSVTPFWRRVPRFFLFPLQRAPLLRNIAATTAFAMFLWLVLPSMAGAPLRSGLLLFLGAVGCSLVIAQFGFLVIERSAAGYLDTRGYPREDAAPNWWRPVKMFLLVIAPLVVLGMLMAVLPKGLVVILLLAFVLLLPASVMVLTTTDSFADAVNPIRGWGVASRIGPPYLVLCLFLFLLSVGSLLFRGALAGGAPAPPGDGAAHAPEDAEAVLMAMRAGLSAKVFFLTLVSNYFLLLACALIGYVMYQYSEALGIAVVGPGDARQAGPISAAAHERRVREAMIGKLIAGGELREAIELLSDEMRMRPADLSLQVRMHELLIQEGSGPRIEANAERYLDLLLARGNLKDALALYEQTVAMFPAFVPRDPAQLPQLAGAAIDALKPDLAARLVRGFDRKYPGHPKVPDVYVLGARIMLQADQARQAKGLLEHVARNYAASPAAAEARRYLARFGPAEEPRAPGPGPKA